MPDNVAHLALTDQFFRDALDEYLDDYKPNPMIKRQLQAWTFEWESVKTPRPSSVLFDPSHALQGCLHIGGEHIRVSLSAECYWKMDDSASSSPKDGSLHLSVIATARFWTKSELSKRQPQPESKKEAKTQEKIRSRLLARYKEDDYINKILSSGSDDNKSSGKILAEATIQKHGNDLEERVDITDSIGEAVRRCILSSAESSIDLIEVLLSLPIFPTAQHTSRIVHTTSLADRAKLRLLEDAMFDACEKEGDEELIEDLSISGKKNDGRTESNSKQSRKKTKAS